MALPRREFLLGSLAAAARAQADVELPEMLFRYFARRLAAVPHAASAREALRRLPGPYPPRCPLEPRITRTLARPGYRIENLLFQSRPDFWVTANVYVPAGPAPPFPAVVMPRGHFDAERMTGDYQQHYFDLVRAGFLILAFDPIGQGERRQHWAEPFDSLFSTTLEHALIGNLLALLGESSAGWYVWDGMRAVDYLLSRPDVDARRIGCADHPDNGSETVLLCALDERIACAALHAPEIPRRFPPDRATWTLPDDTLEYLFGAARAGLDTVDVFASLAPRPLLLLAEPQRSPLPDLAARYAPGRLSVEPARAGEDWPRQLRLASVRWFARWFGCAAPAAETDVVPEPLSALRASPQPAGKSIYALIRERTAGLPPAADPAQTAARLRRLVAPPPAAPRAAVRTLAPGHLQIPSEPGIWLPTGVHRPAKPNGRSVVYVAGDVTAMPADEDDAAPSADPTPERLAARGYVTFAVDVRGIGRSSPALDRRPLRVPYQHLLNPDMMLNFLAWSVADSLFAMRVRDLLCAVDYAARFGPVRVAGRDMGALWALCAAALDPRIEAVAARGGLISFRSLIDCGRYRQASSQIPWGVLREWDLPQVAAAIAPRPLALLDLTDADRRPVNAPVAEAAYAPAREAYRRHSAAARFRIAFGIPLEDLW